jgi:Protein of unknown function (DUF3617)
LPTRFLFILLALSAMALWAADMVHLNIKEGLWQTTSTRLMTGMGIPPEALAKMSPEQRAHVEAMMKQNGLGTPATDVNKECITKEKLEKQLAFSSTNPSEDCTHTVVNSSASKLDMKIHCAGKDNNSDGTFVLEVVNPESVKGKMQLAMNSKGRNMSMDMSFTGRYLGSDCGDIK